MSSQGAIIPDVHKQEHGDLVLGYEEDGRFNAHVTCLQTTQADVDADDVRVQAVNLSSLNEKAREVVLQDGQELSSLATPVQLPPLQPACSLHKLTS